MSWSDFLSQSGDSKIGTEHMVELDSNYGIVGKTTLPPGFGVVPKVRRFPLVHADPTSDSHQKACIEFVDATPLEYLSRWIANNSVFGDDVKLVSVILWKDGLVSFGITQPQYHGEPAEPRDIERFFTEAGWQQIRDPSYHRIFFNYAFAILAIDAETRNCYINDAGLQPFDVILCEPDDEMIDFLQLY